MKADPSQRGEVTIEEIVERWRPVDMRPTTDNQAGRTLGQSQWDQDGLQDQAG